MKKTIVLSFLFAFIVQTIFAQSLSVPRNIQAAMDKGTRATDGRPGKNYWQNKGVYDIKMKVTPETRMVEGTEKILYSNNSPDTLHQLVFRFVNNLRKANAVRASYVPDFFLEEGLTIRSLRINGEKYEEDGRNWSTVGVVPLKKPILPESVTEVEVDWHYPISKMTGREGQVNPTTFFVAYAYPRISVYDDYNGWDLIEHNGRLEFYNNYNDYKYSVTVPKNYIVYGTGDLLNAGQVLQPRFVDRLQQSYYSDTVVHIATADEVRGGKVTLQNDWNTWEFSADHITDITFAISTGYVWDGASVVADPATGRRVSIQTAYADTARDFKEYIGWAQFSMKFFASDWPGIPYPFSKSTSVQANANMEYPMMVNDASYRDFLYARRLQNHEMLHTYFPFYVGINETRYAFMDEGWVTAFEYLLGIAEHGKHIADSSFKAFRSYRYIRDKSSESDQPIITQSWQQMGMGYSSNSYGKPALAYLALKDYMGDSLLKKALHFYIDQWKGKHPVPWDFFNAMNTGSGMNLNWFFKNWFFSHYYIDLKIDKVQQLDDGHAVFVENVGGFAIPFDVYVEFQDGTKWKNHYTPAVWQKNEKHLVFKLTNKKPIKRIEIDNGIFVDYTPEDNVFVGK